ncbi:hypothetical protein CCUS01_09695 [Colletotrichum cuscutae]|uniref:C2H2-type domain-containing protein n=1 Tax=Colletotrichum cuscutae TaxID=1209917 RepID=A0AAI9UFQ3_9PEZI|nr:hypothetical protein CCUS01_09695 [Colletotrichum cuscutae]
MSNSDAKSSSRFHCREPECTLSFTSQSNLNRHKRSKHGEGVLVPCGKHLPNHTSNVQRHQKSCHDCLAVAALPPDSTKQCQSEAPNILYFDTVTTPNAILEDNDFLQFMFHDGLCEMQRSDCDSFNTFQSEGSL